VGAVAQVRAEHQPRVPRHGLVDLGHREHRLELAAGVELVGRLRAPQVRRDPDDAVRLDVLAQHPHEGQQDLAHAWRERVPAHQLLVHRQALEELVPLA
jgi:hypothetical protein